MPPPIATATDQGIFAAAWIRALLGRSVVFVVVVGSRLGCQSPLGMRMDT